MAPDSDDSAAASETSDDTVWPPPPLGPRVVAVRLPAQSLFFLAIPEVLNGFRVPKWAKSAGNCLVSAFVIAWLHTASPALAKVLLGCLVLGIGALLLDFLWGVGTALYAYGAAAVIGKTYAPANRESKNLMPDAGLRISARLMFFVWGLSVLFSSHHRLITWIALVFWVGLLVAGVGVAVGNGVRQWVRNRRQSGHPGR